MDREAWNRGVLLDQPDLSSVQAIISDLGPHNTVRGVANAIVSNRVWRTLRCIFLLMAHFCATDFRCGLHHILSWFQSPSHCAKRAHPLMHLLVSVAREFEPDLPYCSPAACSNNNPSSTSSCHTCALEETRQDMSQVQLSAN